LRPEFESELSAAILAIKWHRTCIPIRIRSSTRRIDLLTQIVSASSAPITRLDRSPGHLDRPLNRSGLGNRVTGRFDHLAKARTVVQISISSCENLLENACMLNYSTSDSSGILMTLGTSRFMHTHGTFMHKYEQFYSSIIARTERCRRSSLDSRDDWRCAKCRGRFPILRSSDETCRIKIPEDHRRTRRGHTCSNMCSDVKRIETRCRAHSCERSAFRIESCRLTVVSRLVGVDYAMPCTAGGRRSCRGVVARRRGSPSRSTRGLQITGAPTPVPSCRDAKL
jgi:hypothetical protein